MKRDNCLILSTVCIVIPIVFIIVYGVSLNYNPLTATECILNNKSLGDYNCTGEKKVYGETYQCVPTKTYELKYLATVKDSNIVKKVYGGRGQTCYCYLFADLFAKVDMPSGLYPIVAEKLDGYNAMIIGQEFECYIDSSGEINMYNEGHTTGKIYTAICICSIIVFIIIILTSICMCYDLDSSCTKCKRRSKYTSLSVNISEPIN